jgi:hypothetical protein
MSLILVAALIIAVPLSVVAFVLLAPMAFGAMAYDATSSSRRSTADPRDLPAKIAVERGVARACVVAGGAFWSIAAFAGLLMFRETGVGAALLGAFYPLAAVAATLIIGWYFERVASAMLALASLAVVVWGVIFQFELGVWMIMTFTLIGPMATASALFWLARRDELAYELALSLHPELAPIGTSHEVNV